MIYSVGVLMVAVLCITTSSAQPTCICAKELKPVCGSDGVTYGNNCLLECARTENPDLTQEKRGRCSPAEGDFCPCTFEHKPVCGSDGVTYDNKCALKCQARKTNINEVHEGQCKQKRDTISVNEPCKCTREGKPVCGTNGKTYGNPCMLNCARDGDENLHVDYEGPCTKNPEGADEACGCTRKLQPVCASDGKTYRNECLMKCAGGELAVVKNDPCT